MNNLNKYRKTILKILVSSGLIIFIITRIDIQQVVGLIKLMDLKFIPLIVFMLFLNYAISAIRWKSLLIFPNSEKVSIKYLFNLYLIGSFFNNFMPTSIGGDVYKFMALGKKIDNRANAFTATFMERFTGIIALMIIGFLGFLFSFDIFIEIFNLSEYAIFKNKWILEGFLVLAFVSSICLALYLLKALSSKNKKIKSVYDSLALYKDRKDILFWAFLTSFIVQFIAIFTQYFIFMALGAGLPLVYALFSLPLITVAAFVVPSLNGIGVQDLLYVSFFEYIGISSELALSASILYHLSRVFVSLFGGLLYVTEKDS